MAEKDECHGEGEGRGGQAIARGNTCCIFTLDFDGTDDYRKSVQINGVPLRFWVNCVNSAIPYMRWIPYMRRASHSRIVCA